ncbi:hypothetical protein [Pontibacillus yanchengensis]|uniref:Inner spore coat protein n=1 Tax=Pontibacillus yanchengensis Y32 TaxID=1385514 RepID=A0A0A2TS25_9BACI|nr:hypothetical protein [Pontibacillus yanchengensis]KGP72065.1 hypothetical protein N782_14395 [Pontibacillus yanchengensis Y32]
MYPYYPNPVYFIPYTPYEPIRNVYQPQIRPTYPEVNTDQLTESAKSFQELMKDAQLVLQKFASSHQFSFDVIDAAQKSKDEKVKQLIKSTGIKHPVDIYYNPDSLRLTFRAKQDDIECCKLTMALHW